MTSDEQTSRAEDGSEPQGHLVLLRHGETAWSRSGQHTGRTDLPLTEHGQDEARRAGAVLDGLGLHVVRVIASPLQRAQVTARLAGLSDLAGRAPVDTDDRLLEWDYGAYEGLTTAEIRNKVGGPWTIFADGVPVSDPAAATPGETLEQVAERCRSLLDDVLADLRTGDVVLVGHGHALRVLAAVFLTDDPRLGARLLLDSGAVCVLEWERGEPAIRRWNLTG